MAMKKKEIILWVLVALALAANIWLPKQHRKYSWERDLSQRLAADFCATREEVKDYVKNYIPDVTDAQIDEWTASGKLENMQIGKETRYFNHAGPNLFRIVPELVEIKAKAEGEAQGTLSGRQKDDADIIPLIKADVADAIAAGSDNPYLAQKKRIRFSYSITVPANTLRRGSTLRCWLPFPRQDVAKQTDIKLIRAGIDSVDIPESRIVHSDPACHHSSIYFETKVKEGRSTTFYEVFEYTLAGEWHPIDPETVLPYDKDSDLYKENTSERSNIVFSDRIRSIADSLTRGIDNPYLQAKAIFTWVDAFPWASAREYSTIENIPEYVLTNGHGDCGQVTLLFMTLCRAKGIPTRWQSGFSCHPNDQNLHDWCEAYFEGCGWVPVDQSFGVSSYSDYFYFGGLDPYRLIVNNDFSGKLSPAKKYPRSETVDFQRGEVEWEGGNLYFNQWDYEFDVEFLD